MGNYERNTSATARCCMNAFKWLPVIIIAAIICWSYYAYVVELCFRTVDDLAERMLYLVLYHAILTLFLWSYFQTIFTQTSSVPPNWQIPESVVENLFRAQDANSHIRILANFAKDLPITNRASNGSVRFCEKCKVIKPDRAHHCSVCGKCILKMDHHCPWVNNCVNFANYKFFVLFLGYALFYCLFVSATTLDSFIDFLSGYQTSGRATAGRFQIIFLFFMAIMLAISLISLFGYHIYLVLKNRTTLEAFRAPIFVTEGPDKNGFNLGKKENFLEVFGDDWTLWLLPVFTSRGNGLRYSTAQPQSLAHTNYHHSVAINIEGSSVPLSDAPDATFLEAGGDHARTTNAAATDKQYTLYSYGANGISQRL